VLHKILVIIATLGLMLTGWTQNSLAQDRAQDKTAPQLKVNMINACSPSTEDKQALVSALALVPRQPKFAPDFEVDRGRSTLDEKPDFLQAVEGAQQYSGDASSSANWVRIRREFPAQTMFSTVQYSFSVDAQNMVETLVFRVRDPKDLLEVTIEDSASAVTSAAGMLAANTPASRVKLERFGKSSVVLARCYATQSAPAPDQSAYDPLFASASSLIAHYRGLLDAQRTVPEELARVTGSTKSSTSASKKSTGKTSSPPNP
jgi:hypothetical protein